MIRDGSMNKFLVEYSDLKSIINEYIKRKGIDGFVSLLSIIEDEAYTIAALYDLDQIEDLKNMNLPLYEESESWKEFGFDIDKLKEKYFGTLKGKIRK